MSTPCSSKNLPRQINPDYSATRRTRVLEDASAAHVEDDRGACQVTVSCLALPLVEERLGARIVHDAVHGVRAIIEERSGARVREQQDVVVHAANVATRRCPAGHSRRPDFERAVAVRAREKPGQALIRVMSPIAPTPVDLRASHRVETAVGEERPEPL